MARSSLLLLSLFAALACIQTSEARGHPRKRAAPDFKVKLWSTDEPIPYIFTGPFNPEEKQLIEAVITTLKDNSCVGFELKEGSEPGLKLEYHMQDGGKCHSANGDVREERNQNQKIYLAHSCINNYTIFHETMHALGFRHTQSRPDRDDYVSVDMDKIPEDIKSDYDKVEETEDTEDYGIPYEFNSIMHYDDGIYMQPKDLDYNTTMGGKRMIFNDWKLLNKRYKCEEKCDTTITCNNGGYKHPRHCDRCVCPQLFSGVNCEVEPEVVNLTPGEAKPLINSFLRDDDILFNTMSENVPFEDYQRSEPKLIKSPEGTHIRVTIVKIIDSESPTFGKCIWKGLEIIDGDLTSVGKRFCWPNSNGHSFVSKTNILGYTVFSTLGNDFNTTATFAVEE